VGSSENILIVEDDESWRQIFQRAVGSQQPNQCIYMARDFDSARQLIEAAKFAVAFVDVGLDAADDTNVDGLHVMEWIRSEGDETSIIVVTGRSGQDVLGITRDAITKYGAYDTVGKSTINPAAIREMLNGGLQAYRNAIAAQRITAQEELRGDMSAMRWDDETMHAIHFGYDVSQFYDFLSRLFGEYLPVVSRLPGDYARPDPSTGLVYGDYWSRAIADGVVVCFGAAEQFDQVIGSGQANGYLLGKYKIGDPIKELSLYGIKGAVFSLSECKREDFRGKQAGGLSNQKKQDAGLLAQEPADNSHAIALIERADGAESDARIALAERSFDEAVGFLQSAIALDPGRADRLLPDLNCLSEEPGDSPERLAWRRGLWLALAAGSPLVLSDTEPVYVAPQIDDEPASEATIIPRFQGKRAVSHKPQKAGADLEVAFIRLLERFFSLAADDERELLGRLRRQRSGTQFGHDIQFDCTTVAHSTVRCHVECKNYSRELKPADVSEKIMQTQAYWGRKEIDYFLIVTPRAGISNDLDHYIQTMNAQDTLPFQIQVWGPEEGIEEFFALEPRAYRKVYGTEPPSVDTEAVVVRWSDKLKPVLRLPRPLRAYLTNPRLHSLVGEDHAHFDTLFAHSIEVDVVSPDGSPMGALNEVLSDWIYNSESQRFLLLGEFGDGKSFACYRLTRLLASEYLSNPSATHFPLRLPLRDLISAGNPQELLSRRLQALGADMRDWARLQDLGPTLIVLDGFDEISAQLDHATMVNNLHLLADCVRYFVGSKLLVTSRTHYFENTRMQERFLEQLDGPEVARLAPLPLSKRIKYLHAYAEQEGLSDKFERIRRLYDPIGLAGKPLFLQMIKETLPNLPDDYFDEIALYETSVRDSLKRKAEMLVDEGMHTLRGEAIQGITELLESLAVELLKNGGQPVDLRTFGAGKYDVARVLWKMSEADAGTEQTYDARARLGMRSLLKPFPKENDSGAWPVAFCHRSMSEYFVAQALVRALRHNSPTARELLTTVILRSEIVDFVALLMNKGDDTKAMAQTVARLACSAVRGTKSGYVGGNAITLAYRSRHKPSDHVWIGLDLGYADLSGADLAGADFTDSLLQYATLDNADLSGADLTRCDLTGVRLEETAPVIHVASGRTDSNVIACYGDGTIREWLLGGYRPVPRKLLDGLGNLKSAAWGPYGDLIVIDGRRLSLWSITEDGSAQNNVFPIRSGIEHVRFVYGVVSFAWTDENQSIAISVDCRAATVGARVRLTHPGPVAFAAHKTALMTLAGNVVAIARLDKRDSLPIEVPADVTALDVRREEPGTAELAVAETSGEVTTLQVTVSGGTPEPGALTLQHLHQGPVLSITFLAEGFVATGGMDRSLIICECDNGQLRALYRLNLTLRCAGIKTVGVQGNYERQLLEALRDRAEEH
jgi:ActR/RegA family two-component response regulator